MHAEESRLRPLLEGTLQYQIPRFQRSYAWTRTEWAALWKAIERQYELVRSGEPGPTHFLGSFVFSPAFGMAAAPSPQRVVDGQQRLTTIQVLIAAMRDLLAESDPIATERFNDLYLMNKYQEGEKRYKLVPSVHDRDAFFALLDGAPPSAATGVGAAYRYFKNELLRAKLEGWDLNVLEEVIVDRVYVVEISTSVEDSVHRIFQTLNSSGVALDQVDLLRNHFFMLLPTVMESTYETYWQPLEMELGVRELDYFLWADLICRGREFEGLARKGVYTAWQKLLEGVEGHENQVVGELQGLLSRGRVYRSILNPSMEPDPALRRALERAVEWGSTIHRPIILKIMLDRFEETLTLDQALESLHYLESYLVRRLLAKVPTNQLNRIFASLLATVNGAPLDPGRLRQLLSTRGNNWPSDSELQARMRREEFYRAQQAPQRQFVLRRIEEAAASNEVVNWGACDFTLEHVMPQHLTEPWFFHLEAGGDAPIATHAELLHTIGNVTLTCYNPSLSDRPFAEKRVIYADSGLRMNREIADLENWGRDSMLARSDRLAAIATGIWSGPLELSDAGPDEASVVLKALVGSLAKGSWTDYAALATVAGMPASSVLAQLRESPSLPGIHRVAQSDGVMDLQAPWAASDVEGYMQLLAGEGILAETADGPRMLPEARLTAEDLSELLGDA
jgi:alkylated DNA nucleotide flippase Atl1